MWSEEDQIVEKITGLNPKAILCVGKGFVREEWKALCFKKGKAIGAHSILNQNQIAQLLVPESKNRVLDPSARVELLRQAVKKTEVRAALPILTQRRFRPRFFEALDRSLQSGRMMFAHSEEGEVIRHRLAEKTGVDLKRDEFFDLSRYWERLLEHKNLWDEGRLFFDATQKLAENNLPELLREKTVFRLQHFSELPRIQLFWSELARVLPVQDIQSSALTEKLTSPSVLERRVAHSQEDAGLFLIENILEKCESGDDLLSHAVVIPDQPAVRRCLKRIAEMRGIKLLDARDPTQMIQSEELKLSLLELELAAKNFPTPLVFSWLNAQPRFRSELGDLRKQMVELGLTGQLESYRRFPLVYEALKKVQNRYPARITLAELAEAVTASTREFSIPSWVEQSLDRMVSEWSRSLLQLELQHRKWPLRHWFEQLKEKVLKATPVVLPHRNRFGLQLFRADQAISLPLLSRSGEGPALQIHFFGMDVRYFEARDSGNEWFSARDHEILSLDFGVVSMDERQKQIESAFCGWAKLGNASPRFWDYEYDESGGEREPATLDFLENLQVTEVEMGMHPSLGASLHHRLETTFSQVQLPLPKSEWPVSFLNAYGNCGFQGYAGHLLKLNDERETDFELGGDVFGNLVHGALEIMVKEKLEPEASFDRAWEKLKTTAWIRNERLAFSIRHKTLRILTSFLESENNYQDLSRAVPTCFEEPIEFTRKGLVFKGRIDRIDQHADGMVVVDYKTATVPNGLAILEKGIELQLPVYALAVQEKFKQTVIGAQYLQVKPSKPNRNYGVLFAAWNKSKKADPVEYPLTNARSNSASVFQESPEEVWGRFDQKVTQLVDRMNTGDFSAVPAEPKNCERCRFILVCGRLRAGAEESSLEEMD